MAFVIDESVCKLYPQFYETKRVDAQLNDLFCDLCLQIVALIMLIQTSKSLVKISILCIVNDNINLRILLLWNIQCKYNNNNKCLLFPAKYAV